MTRRIVVTSTDDPPSDDEMLVYDAAQDSWDSIANPTAGYGDVVTHDADEFEPVGSIAAMTGVITPYAGSSAPTGWLLCDGSAVSRATYAALFSVVGTAYGAGDGSTTFNVPNLEGRFVVGMDSGDTDFDSLGETGGAKTHTHAKGSLAADANTSWTNVDITPISSVASYAHGHAISGTTASGDSLPPYMALPYIIKT